VNLFLVVLGGRSRGCHIEQHDVRWVVGDAIDDTLPELVRQWGGLRRGLHLDSYRMVNRVDGHQVVVHAGADTGNPRQNSHRPEIGFLQILDWRNAVLPANLLLKAIQQIHDGRLFGILLQNHQVFGVSKRLEVLIHLAVHWLSHPHLLGKKGHQEGLSGMP